MRLNLIKRHHAQLTTLKNINYFIACRYRPGTDSICTTNKNVAISDFNSITVSSGIDLYLKQGNAESVKVVSDADLLKNVIVEKKENTLHIRYKDNVSWERIFKGQKIKAYVSYKTLNCYFLQVAEVMFLLKTRSKHQNLHISASGGSDIKLDLMTQDLQVQSSGGADIKFKRQSYQYGNQFERWQRC